jgi:putative spermidine/putrescine transport system ATP-binding protein
MSTGTNKELSLPISVKNLVKNYGSLKVLDNISIDIKPGEFMTLLGPSGSGKTTLLMALAGFISPESGSILFGEKEVITLSPHKRGVGMVFQNYALFPFMSVIENICYPLKIRGLSSSEQKKRAEAALHIVKLDGYADRRISQLSGGQKQRVALARAIVFEPRIILMDEPLSALDKKLREHMQIELKQLHQKLDATIVYVTHDQREALTMSDRIAVINNGRIAQLDTTTSLYRSPKSLFVADFIGETEFLPIDQSGSDFVLQGQKLKIKQKAVEKIGNYKLVLRPELLQLNTENRDDFNYIHGVVRQAIFQGDSVLLIVDTGNGNSISARIPTSRSGQASIPENGNNVSLGLHREDTIVLAG